MRRFNREQLEDIFKNHILWVGDSTKGARADLSEADLSETDLYGVNLSEANLFKANLYGVNLSGANLTRADLSGANLSGANLTRADLSGANLSGVDLSWTTGVVGFYLGEYFGFMSLHNKYVRIGCEGMPLDDWLEKYEKLAIKHGYSEEIIQKYLNFGKYLKENF